VTADPGLRARILEAAETEFARGGFTATKILHIARRAEVPSAVAYRSFSGKTALWNSLHAERASELAEEVRREAAVCASASEALLAAAGAMALYFADRPVFHELQIAHGINWATADANSLSRGGQKEFWTSTRALLLSYVRRSLDDRQIGGQSPTTCVSLLIATVQVMTTDWWLRGRPESRYQLANDVVSVLKRQLAPHPAVLGSVG